VWSLRPGHFQSCYNCDKLLTLVQPERAYFGQKDAQQLAIMVGEGFEFAGKIVACPTVRKAGLTLSSRNQYLTTELIEQAATLYRGLQAEQARWERLAGL